MPHQFQQALHRAIFAEAAMQGVERRIGFGLEKLIAGIVAGIHHHRIEAFLARAFITPRPEDSETSRSAERPPINTAMRCIAVTWAAPHA